MVVGNFYIFDIPSALKEQLQSVFIRQGVSEQVCSLLLSSNSFLYDIHNPQDFETQFGLFYSSYSMPNVILPFLGGMSPKLF
jgi:hypothetical protein